MNRGSLGLRTRAPGGAPYVGASTRIHRFANLALSSAGTRMTYDTVDWDELEAADLSVATDRLTFRRAGRYELIGSLLETAPGSEATNYVTAYILRYSGRTNSTGVEGSGQTSDNYAWTVCARTERRLTTGRFFTLYGIVEVDAGDYAVMLTAGNDNSTCDEAYLAATLKHRRGTHYASRI